MAKQCKPETTAQCEERLRRKARNMYRVDVLKAVVGEVLIATAGTVLGIGLLLLVSEIKKK